MLIKCKRNLILYCFSCNVLLVGNITQSRLFFLSIGHLVLVYISSLPIGCAPGTKNKYNGFGLCWNY